MSYRRRLGPDIISRFPTSRPLVRSRNPRVLSRPKRPAKHRRTGWTAEKVIGNMSFLHATFSIRQVAGPRCCCWGRRSTAVTCKREFGYDLNQGITLGPRAPGKSDLAPSLPRAHPPVRRPGPSPSPSVFAYATETDIVFFFGSSSLSRFFRKLGDSRTSSFRSARMFALVVWWWLGQAALRQHLEV